MAVDIYVVAVRTTQVSRDMTLKHLILASGSPRRKDLLGQLGLQFSIERPDIDESVLEDEQASVYVQRLSREKAESVRHRFDTSEIVILAADTTVVLEGNILGKPESKEQGLSMLKQLSATTHEVLTGVTVIGEGTCSTISVSSEVTFRALQQTELEHYWALGEAQDKAGGYGLQGAGATFVASLSGSHSNVVGLPMAETVSLLRASGIVCLGMAEHQLRG